MVILIILGIILAAVVAGIAFGFYRTYKSEHGDNQAKFRAGTLPTVSLDGFYNGHVSGYKGTWRGKTFSSARGTGINRFGEADRYTFKFYPGTGARDKLTRVIKINYNISGNPFWLRPFLDEIVETAPGQYLGKLHLRLIPGLPLTLGYFSLQKP